MTNKDEALKMAIDFMETLTIDVGIKTWNEKHRKEAINACKEALEQPTMTYEQGFAHGYEAHRVEQAQEQLSGKEGELKPVALIKHENGNFSPKHHWQGLTDDEISKLFVGHTAIDFARAIEQALKEKNT
jgi:hypothetical protein